MSALHTLVVDDSASARTLLKRLLERKGVQVDQSESAPQALDYLKSKKPDLIFMDHTMPGMNGLEAVRAIRQDPATASIPVVMYTSENGEHYLREALATGAQDLIPKPATWGKLSQVLDDISHQRQLMSDEIAISIDQQLSSLRDHLSFAMERQIQRVCDEVQNSFDQRIKTLELRQNTASPYTAQGLSSLIHSITDSKLHQLNLELRHHLSAKLDVLAQDLLQQQQAQRQELLQELDLRLQPQPQPQKTAPDWLTAARAFLRQRWYALPFWLALCLMVGTWVWWYH